MVYQELLQELTESYLKSLISEVAGSLRSDFDSFAPFRELGINSFYVLKIIKRLEADFGTLPKSLLFENFNIHDLARYFVAKHETVLASMFCDGLRAGSPAQANGQNRPVQKPEPSQGAASRSPES